MNRLVLIDGSAILHRAYHALPPLTTPAGELVNAVYGFVSMLIKLVHDLKPTHLAVAFDRPKPTFRQEIFKEYQAQRPKMEEELVSQIAKVHEVIGALGIPIYEVDGFEADDIIGTLAKKATMDQVIIVTGDRDLLQLVDDDKVLVYMPVKGLSEAKLYGEKEVKDKLGITPSQVPDFKALAGDASDNYPGVPGVGPKTAIDLINQFGSLSNLLKSLKGQAKLPPVLADKLKQGAESAKLSHQLATIRTDVPLEVDLGKARLTTLDTPQAREALQNLHFPSLLKRLIKPQESEKNAKPDDQPQLF